MVILRDILLGIWQAFLGLVQFFADRTAEAGIEVDILLLAAMAVGVTVWLGSGAWASSIASCRRHSAKLHFVIGLLVPYLYPAVILFAMDIKGAKEREQKQRELEEQRKAEEAERERVASLTGRELGEDGEPPEKVFNAEYFESIARDEQGNPTGPWRIVFGDTEVKALRILDPLPDVLAIEIEGRDGKPQRFRIPYSRITECEPC